MFATYNDNFIQDGWIIDANTLAVDVSGITVPVVNGYVPGDETCDPEINRGVTNQITDFYGEFTDESITHHNINTANDNANVSLYLNLNLGGSCDSVDD